MELNGTKRKSENETEDNIIKIQKRNGKEVEADWDEITKRILDLSPELNIDADEVTRKVRQKIPANIVTTTHDIDIITAKVLIDLFAVKGNEDYEKLARYILLS